MTLENFFRALPEKDALWPPREYPVTRFRIMQHLYFIIFFWPVTRFRDVTGQNDEAQMLHKGKAKATKWRRQEECEKLCRHLNPQST